MTGWTRFHSSSKRSISNLTTFRLALNLLWTLINCSKRRFQQVKLNEFRSCKILQSGKNTKANLNGYRRSSGKIHNLNFSGMGQEHVILELSTMVKLASTLISQVVATGASPCTSLRMLSTVMTTHLNVLMETGNCSLPKFLSATQSKWKKMKS